MSVRATNIAKYQLSAAAKLDYITQKLAVGAVELFGLAAHMIKVLSGATLINGAGERGQDDG